MRIRIGLSLGRPVPGPVRGVGRPARGRRGRLAVAAGDRVRPGRRPVHRDDVRAREDHAPQGRSGSRCSRGAIRCWSPSSSPRWRGWRRAGCCRCSGCSRPSRRAALFPVPAGQRGAVFDEALELLRLMLTTDLVAFDGSFFTCRTPRSRRGRPSRSTSGWPDRRRPGCAGWAARRRLARVAAHPGRGGAAVAVINAAADEAGRQVDDDHFGISLAIAFGGLPTRSPPRSGAAGPRPTR